MVHRNMLLCSAVSVDQPHRPGDVAERSVMLKKLNAIPALKYPLIAIAILVWMFGLADQIPDFIQTAKYVGISALMVAVAALA